MGRGSSEGRHGRSEGRTEARDGKLSHSWRATWVRCHVGAVLRGCGATWVQCYAGAVLRGWAMWLAVLRRWEAHLSPRPRSCIPFLALSIWRHLM